MVKGSRWEQLSVSAKALSVLAGLMVFSVIVILVYSLEFEWSSRFLGSLKSTGIWLMIALACLIAGGLLGFLFGIPRFFQPGVPEDPASDSNPTGPANSGYRPNTNLEQISDWLAKILVGVGLVELVRIKANLIWIAGLIAQGLGNTQANKIFALFSILFFFAAGFLFAYLWTRIYFPGVLEKSLAKSLREVNQKVDLIDAHTSALNLVDKQLNLDPESVPVGQEELNRIVEQASEMTRVAIFYRTHLARRDNKRLKDLRKMELCIPVFRALINADREDEYHRNHGQLGYALKDKENPDYSEAINELTKAISIRDRMKMGGWTLYELNRALCHIRQDEPAAKDEWCNLRRPSHEDVKNIILRDLDQAKQFESTRKIVETDPEIQKWILFNNPDGIDKIQPAEESALPTD